MSMFLEYDYPIGKKMEDLTEEDLDNIEYSYNKEVSDLYRENRNHKIIKSRNKKINRILQNI